MSELASAREEAIFQLLLPQLEAEGFEVFKHPPRFLLPPFLQDHCPDAIAIKGDRKIAIEVVGETANPDAKAQRLSKAFNGHPDWELHLVHAARGAADQDIPAASRSDIEARLAQIERSLDVMGPSAALLYGWAVFEAAARSLDPAALKQAQTPVRLLEKLASEGYVTPDEADALRRLTRLRNEVAHGRMDVTPERAEVVALLDITRTLLTLDR